MSEPTPIWEILAASGPVATVLGVAVVMLWRELQAERLRARRAAEKWEKFLLDVMKLDDPAEKGPRRGVDGS